MTTVGAEPAAGDAQFEAERPRLLGLAYRMLGTVADAEDIVQEAWLRWNVADQSSIRDVPAWLTTVTTRLALDRLGSAQRRREQYVGPWLPEPIVTEPGPEQHAELAESLTLGFLHLLDRLTPVERAVVLLADVFAYPFADVAHAVGRSEVACRQIASRARRRLREAPPSRGVTTSERHVVDALLVALGTGDVDAALARLAPDVVLLSDGGAERHAARRPVVGADRVARFLHNLTRRYLARAAVRPAVVNGDPGVVVELDGEPDLVAAFEVAGERIAAVWVIRAPDKLAHLGRPFPVA